MSDSLFNLFASIKSAKLIWKTLDQKKKKTKVDDVGKCKYATSNWLNIKIVDSKPIVEQLHQYKNLVAELMGEGICFEVLQANFLIEKCMSHGLNFTIN